MSVHRTGSTCDRTYPKDTRTVACGRIVLCGPASEGCRLVAMPLDAVLMLLATSTSPENPVNTAVCVHLRLGYRLRSSNQGIHEVLPLPVIVRLIADPPSTTRSVLYCSTNTPALFPTFSSFLSDTEARKTEVSKFMALHAMVVAEIRVISTYTRIRVR